MKKRADLDMATILNATLEKNLAVHASHTTEKVPGWADLSPQKQSDLRESIMPIIWHALPAIIAQLSEDEIEPLLVPDTLEGLL